MIKRKRLGSELFIIILLLLLLLHGIYDTAQYATNTLPLNSSKWIGIAQLCFNQLVKLIAIVLLWQQKKAGWHITAGIYLFVIFEGAIVIISALPQRSAGLLITLLAMSIAAFIIFLLHLPAMKKNYGVNRSSYWKALVVALLILGIYHINR
ncbi:MAG: hypothetical protein SFU21_03770 [Flavihumibacter sp.]|nr:hypothetical protein [Flavihumibacter sp.]